MSINKDFSLDKLAVIIPLHEYTEDNETLLKNAICSVPDELDIVLVAPDGVYDKLSDESKARISANILNDTEKTDFCSQVNFAVKALDVKYEWISILEFDDSYNKTPFINSLKKYISGKPEFDVYLTLQYLIDITKSTFVGFANEMSLAMPKDGKFGELDEEFVKEVYNQNLTGAIIKRDVFVDLRPSIKIYFFYEWLMRVMRKGARVYTIPKVCYNHSLMRDGSIFAEYQKTVTGSENNYWMNVARESAKLDNDATNYQYQQSKKAE